MGDLIFYFSPKKNEYTSKLEREIEKLQVDIDTIKRDIDKPGDDTMTSMGSTIQAPTNNGPIGEVIAELKAHNYKKHEYKRQQDALELSDEEVDPPLGYSGGRDAPQYESKAILIPDTAPKADLRSTLQDRWRVPALTVKPLDNHSVSQVESSVI